MTANALCSLSLDPLLLLVCFARSARTLPLVQTSGRFAVNVLRHEQHALSGVVRQQAGRAGEVRGRAVAPARGRPRA